MPSFNLVTEPWIPCAMSADGSIRELGLRDALVRAHEIGEISDPSPLVLAALHRLLLAILHRNFGARSTGEWAEHWTRGHWPSGPLDAYFQRWGDQFDLFDSYHPFYQAPSLDFQYERSITQLTHELVSGANPATLFDHTLAPVLVPAQAARYLVAFQSFTVGGLVSLEKGQDPKKFKSADGAPLVKAAVGLVRGDNLFRTLTLNFHRLAPEDGEPFEPGPKDDVLAWERHEETQAEERRPDGYLDLLTWQSRRIRLHPELDQEGRLVVRRVVIMKGNQFPDTWENHVGETMVAFKAIQKAAKGQKPWVPVAFQEDRALWRDSLSILQSVGGQQIRPKTLTWLGDLVEAGVLSPSWIPQMDFFGLGTDRAKVLFWRHERLPLPLSYLEGRELIGLLSEALRLAEGVGRLFQPGFDQAPDGEQAQVRRPFHTLAALLLSPADATKANPDTVQKLLAHLAPGRLYWSRLEVPFRSFLVSLAAEAESDGDSAGEKSLAFAGWAETLRRSALEAFQESTGSLDSSARALRARAVAERQFRGRLNAILKSYLPEQNGGVGDESAH